jgi:hypothetical protein
MNQIDAMKSARLLIEGTAFTLHTLPSGQACICSQCDFVRGKVAVLNDLRQAIEQAEKAEPVGSVVEDDNDFGRVKAILDQDARVQLAVGTQLYIHPPPAPPTAPAQPAVSVDELAKEYTKELDKLSQRNYELRMLNAGLTDALRLFVASAYPVDTAINSRGYNWSEAYLDQALQVATETAPAQPARSALEQYDLDQSADYRKGYEDGRLKGFEVGHRYAKEQAPAQQPDQQTVLLIQRCRDAFAEELSAYDIDPPIYHVKQGYDDCVKWLEAHIKGETK